MPRLVEFFPHILREARARTLPGFLAVTLGSQLGVPEAEANEWDLVRAKASQRADVIRQITDDPGIQVWFDPDGTFTYSGSGDDEAPDHLYGESCLVDLGTEAGVERAMHWIDNAAKYVAGDDAVAAGQQVARMTKRCPELYRLWLDRHEIESMSGLPGNDDSPHLER